MQTEAPYIVSALLLVGMYAPSSLGGEYSTGLWLVSLLLLALALFAAALKSGGVGSNALCLNSGLMVAILFAATAASPFAEYRWGGMLGFWLLALLFVTRCRQLTGGATVRTIFFLANVVNVALGAAVIAGNETAGNFLSQYFSAFYPELVPHMMEMHKPVLTFSSHSLAAFFCYLFFYLNFESYKRTRKGSDLGFALAYMIFCLAMQSFTGTCLLLLASLQTLRFFARKRLALTLAGTLAVCGLLAWGVLHYLPDDDDRALAGQLLSATLDSESNGFVGRFSGQGTLYSTVAYIRARPFSPVGVGYHSALVFGDSGLVEYYLRGSIFLVLSVYLGLYVFLKTNLRSKRHAHFLFFLMLAFETGFSSLTYIRTLYLLPVIVIYLNDLRLFNEDLSPTTIAGITTGTRAAAIEGMTMA